MTTSRRTRLMGATAVILTAVVGFASPSSAAGPPDAVIDLPAGVACDFALQVEIRGGPQVFREFTDENGNVVRTLLAGKGSALLFRNLATGATLSLNANGSVNQTSFEPDGSYTSTVTGHNVLILFPTDVPAGPSTTLHVGRVVFTVNTLGIFTVTEVSGDTTDICAALSS